MESTNLKQLLEESRNETERDGLEKIIAMLLSMRQQIVIRLRNTKK